MSVGVMADSLDGRKLVREDNNLSVDQVQILVGRVIHDLSNPIGALGNGVELALEQETIEPAVRDLLALSRRTTLARIKLLGMIFARPDNEKAGHLRAVANALTAYFQDKPKVSLTFPAGEAPHGFAMLLPLLVMVGVESMIKGGRIEVIEAIDQEPWCVKASGPSLRLEQGVLALLAGAEAPSTPHRIFAVFAAKLAGELGWQLTTAVSQTESASQLVIRLKKV